MRIIDMKYDSDKNRWDLLPLETVNEMVSVLTFGLSKYKKDNWKTLENFEDRYYSALMRHLYAWKSGENYDKESGFLHLSHAFTNVMFLLWFSLKKEKLGFLK